MIKMTAELWTHVKHFKPAEFEDPANMEFDLLERLDLARQYSGIPYVVTSSDRTKAENAAVGGAPDSSHPRGYAVDLRCHTDANRGMILKGVYAAGFTRVGIYADHIHVDCDPSLDPDVAWRE